MNSKTKAVAGAGAGLLALSMIGGGTFALWSDYETVTGNSVAAGTLELEIDDAGGGAALPLTATALAPGENKVTDVYLASRGDDTAALQGARLELDIQNLIGTENGCDTATEDEDEVANGDTSCNLGVQTPGGQFADQAHIQVASKPASSPTACPGGGYGNFTQGVLQTVADNSNSMFLGNLDPSPASGVCVRIEMGLPGGGPGGDDADGIDFAGNADTDNAPQGDSATFDLRFDLLQVIPNP